MKFGKEFAAQKVPEWEEAYMNYNYLKSLIKDIQLSIQKDKPPPPTPAMTSSTATPRHINRRLSLYRAFSGLTRSRHNQSELSTSPSPPEGSDQSDHSFLMASEEGEDIKIEYLRKVDDELNKVDKFYKAKVDEVMKEANVLNKQMDALIAFRVKMENPQRMFDWSGEITRLASDVASSTAHLAASTPREVKASRRADVALDVIEEGDSSSSHSGEDEKEKDEVVDVKKVVKVEKPRKFRVSRPAPLDVLSHVTMNKTVETPVSTIKGFLNVSQQTELKFSRENLIKVEEQLKSAFVVFFYQKLRLLKSFG